MVTSAPSHQVGPFTNDPFDAGQPHVLRKHPCGSAGGAGGTAVVSVASHHTPAHVLEQAEERWQNMPNMRAFLPVHHALPFGNVSPDGQPQPAM
jgi:hypothetical protein